MESASASQVFAKHIMSFAWVQSDQPSWTASSSFLFKEHKAFSDQLKLILRQNVRFFLNTTVLANTLKFVYLMQIQMTITRNYTG